MSWSYAKERGNTGYTSGGVQIIWDNAWTVTELSPTQAGYVRLQVVVTTYQYYNSPSYYMAYSTDTVSYGGSSVTIQAQTTAGYSYTTTIQVPSGWCGKTVTFNIAWKEVSVVLGASPSTPSSVSASNGTFGSAIPITITPQFSGVTHTVWASCAGRTETLISNSSATSVNWTPAVATYAPLITSANSASATITCNTYYNGSYIGQATKSITVSFAANSIAPTVTSGWVSHAYYNTGTAAAGIAAYVQGYSKAQVTFNSAKITPKYGASIASYKIVCGSVTATASPYRTGVLTGTSATITCYVIDSRGQYTAGTLSVTLNAYAKPSLSGVLIFRCNSGGTADADGTYASARATANISSISGLNSYTLTAYSRAVGGSYASQGAMSSDTAKILSGFSPDTTYDIKITLTDALGNSAVYEQRLATRAWAMKFRSNGNGVAFGKAAETDKMLEVPSDWTIKIGNLAIKDGQSGAGYTKLPDGTLIQWGTFTFTNEIAANDTGVEGVGFPVAFFSTAYAASVTVNGTSVPAQRTAGVGTKATTWMNINAQENYGAAWTPYVDWVAVGRWK